MCMVFGQIENVPNLGEDEKSVGQQVLSLQFSLGRVSKLIRLLFVTGLLELEFLMVGIHWSEDTKWGIIFSSFVRHL